MASNRRSREARLLEPLLARRPNELPDNALGPTINDLYQAIAAHKAGHDHDWIYFTKDEIINMWLGAYNPNILIPAIPGTGILFDGNVVKIDTSRDYSWLGNHTFAALINGTISDAANADKLDTYHASDFWKKAETVSYATSAGSAGYATSAGSAGSATNAGNADTVDSLHASDFLRSNIGWTTYSPGTVGWSSITGAFKYFLIGKFCAVSLDVTSGTSNGTNALIALPFAGIANQFSGGVLGLCIDNGVLKTTPGKYYVNPNSGYLECSTDMGAGVFTASGTKRIRCQFFYQIA